MHNFFWYLVLTLRLDLLLLQTMFPDGHVRGDTVFTVVEQNNPATDISTGGLYRPAM